MAFIPLEDNFFQSRNDPYDKRLGDIIERNTSPPGIAILGYPDDEGVELNSGRLGTREGPNRIRSHLYKYTVREDFPRIYDIGNLDTALPLEKRHERAASVVFSLYEKGFFPVSIGGGHDYGFPDSAAYCRHMATLREDAVVINIDTHLDVRPPNPGFSSGTPFYRLLTEFPKTELWEVGIQKHTSSSQHIRWAQERNVKIITLEEIKESGESLVWHFRELMNRKKASKKVFLSIDIDAFSSAYAPGCSQGFATGLVPNDILSLIKTSGKELEIIGLGIYEVAPCYDVNDITSKLAAQLIYQFISQNSF